MDPPRDTAPRWRRKHGLAHSPVGAFSALAALPVVVLALSSCGLSQHPAPRDSSLLSGRERGAPVAARLAPAVRLARRFAVAYARGIYKRRQIYLPGATAALERDIAAAAARVPPARRGLHPRALAVALEPRSAVALAATVKVGDGHSPPFSVGFLVKRRGSRWRVVAISPPG